MLIVSVLQCRSTDVCMNCSIFSRFFFCFFFFFLFPFCMMNSLQFVLINCDGRKQHFYHHPKMEQHTHQQLNNNYNFYMPYILSRQGKKDFHTYLWIKNFIITSILLIALLLRICWLWYWTIELSITQFVHVFFPHLFFLIVSIHLLSRLNHAFK